MNLLSTIKNITFRRSSSAKAKENAEYSAYLAKRNALISDGWTEWLYSYPTFPVIATRPEWGDVTYVYYNSTEVSPYMNVAGLYWKPWTGETIVTEFANLQST